MTTVFGVVSSAVLLLFPLGERDHEERLLKLADLQMPPD